MLEIVHLLLHLVVVSLALISTHARFGDLVTMSGHETLEWNVLAILWRYDYLVGLHPKSIRFHGLIVG